MADKLAINQALLSRNTGICTGLFVSAIATLLIANPATSEEIVTIPQAPVQPSLWWKTQRLPEGWVENIVINSETRQAIVTLNLTRWTASDYLQRFSFLFQLGTEAQKNNFGVLLHNRRAQTIAEYSVQQEKWRIEPKSLGTDPFRVTSPTILQRQF